MKKRITSILLLLVLTFSLIGCAKNDPEVVSVNNQIEELTNIQDNKEAIFEIMNIREEIELLSKKQKKWVETKQLSVISNRVSNELKDSVAWKQYLDKESDYTLLSNFIDLSNIAYLSITSDLSSSLGPKTVTDPELIRFFKESIDLPYIGVTDKEEFFKSLMGPSESPKQLMRISVCYLLNEKEQNFSFWFGDGWVFFNFEENEQSKSDRYVSLVELTKEQLNTIFQ